jgi:hypothetical protein
MTEYNKNKVMINLHCKKCNRYWISSWNKMMLGSDCSYCLGKGINKKNNNKIKNKRKFLNLSNVELLYPFLATEWDYEKNKDLPNKYRPKSSKQVNWVCSQCKHNWIARICDRAIGTGCPACKMSGGAKKIYFWLKENNFCFDIEYEFNDLLSNIGNPLKYDFAIFKNKNKDIPDYLIEFDGDQHKKFVSIFHKSIDDFMLRKEYDERKDSYAKNNFINLIRLSNKEYKDIEVILLNQLTSCVTLIK